MEDEALTPREVAKMLHRETTTLAWWRSTGRGPAYFKSGVKVLYRRQDVEEYRDANTTRP